MNYGSKNENSCDQRRMHNKLYNFQLDELYKLNCIPAQGLFRLAGLPAVASAKAGGLGMYLI
jgi:hypothetical protein